MSTASQPSAVRRPPKAERDHIRREQIIVAARHCVVRNGFHAASMAEIAAAAHMSVGQIYRYFPNKEAIIHSIVERIVAARLQGMVELGPERDMVDTLADKFAEALGAHRDDQILMLEVTAEATRNPTIAETIKRADQLLKERAASAMLENDPGLTREDAQSRVELLAVLMEGTVFRRLGGVMQDRVPYALYRSVIERVVGK